MNYVVLAFYHLVPIEDPIQEVAIQKTFLKPLDAACRVYISEQGINAQMSFEKEACSQYVAWMEERPEFKGIHYKIDPYHELVFPRKTVKYKKHLVAIDEEVDLSNQGEHLAPEEWKTKLLSEEPKLVLDVRNSYEWEVGRFEGATLPPCETFREFSQYADELSQQTDDKSKPVMMYCTGGIRCELYSSILKDKGFENVYQLNGGVIHYGHQVGGAGWQGKLFVFDDRLTVPVGEEEVPVIGKCHFCQIANESYYNCANMDCNHLFLCCPACLENYQGCCCTDCQIAPRVRPYHQQNPHKPFRKKSNYSIPS